MIELVSALKRASRGEVLRDVPLASPGSRWAEGRTPWSATAGWRARC